METLLKQHSALLAPAVPAAPLGSLLDAIDDGHVSPPRSKVCSVGGGRGQKAAMVLPAVFAGRCRAAGKGTCRRACVSI